jgi:hypothetical protein
MVSNLATRADLGPHLRHRKMDWSAEHHKAVMDAGFCFLPERLDTDEVLQLRRLIENDLAVDPPLGPKMKELSHFSFCPNLRSSFSSIAERCGAWEFILHACGDVLQVEKAQIALRVSGEVGTPHIDGFIPFDGQPANPPVAILGLYLDDVMSVNDGALLVWPGERVRVQQWCRKRSGAILRPTLSSDAGSMVPDVSEPSSAPVAVLGVAGSMFLLHGAVPHTHALKVTAGLRCTIYQRAYRHDRLSAAREILESGGSGWSDSGFR